MRLIFCPLVAERGHPFHHLPPTQSLVLTYSGHPMDSFDLIRNTFSGHELMRNSGMALFRNVGLEVFSGKEEDS